MPRHLKSEHNLHHAVEAVEQSEKMMLSQASQHELEEAEELHPDLHALAGHWTRNINASL